MEYFIRRFADSLMSDPDCVLERLQTDLEAVSNEMALHSRFVLPQALPENTLNEITAFLEGLASSLRELKFERSLWKSLDLSDLIHPLQKKQVDVFFSYMETALACREVFMSLKKDMPKALVLNQVDSFNRLQTRFAAVQAEFKLVEETTLRTVKSRIIAAVENADSDPLLSIWLRRVKLNLNSLHYIYSETSKIWQMNIVENMKVDNSGSNLRAMNEKQFAEESAKTLEEWLSLLECI